MVLKIRKDGAWVNIDPEDSGAIKAYANGALSAGDPVVLNSDGTVSKVFKPTATSTILEGPSTPYNGTTPGSDVNTSEWTNTNSNITSISVVCIGGGGGGGRPDRGTGGGAGGLGHGIIPVQLNDVFDIQAGAGGAGGNAVAGSLVNGYSGADTWIKDSNGTLLVMGEGGEAGGDQYYNGEGGTYFGDGGGDGGDGGYQNYDATVDACPGGGGAGGYNGKGGDGGSTYDGNDNNRNGEDAAVGSGAAGGGGADSFYSNTGGSNGAGAGGGGTGLSGKGADGEGGAVGEEGGYGGEGGSGGEDGDAGGERQGSDPDSGGETTDDRGGDGGEYGGGGGKGQGMTSGQSGHGARGAIKITPLYPDSASNLTANNYIGFSESSYASNDTARINVIGSIDTNQSGLTVGEKYYIQPDGTLSITAGNPKVEAGIALNSTTLLVSGGALLGTGAPPPFTTQGWDIE